MFNAMMRYRLAAIWRGLLMAIASSSSSQAVPF